MKMFVKGEEIKSVEKFSFNFSDVELVHKEEDSVLHYKVRIEDLVNAFRQMQEEMNDEERIEFWDNLQEGYCKYCGSKYLPCYCSNDE